MKTRMREMRDVCGKSLMRVHRETGVPYGTLQRWEHGGLPKAPLERVALVARSLRCRVDDLFAE